MPFLESESDSKAAPVRQELKVCVDELLGTLTPKQAEAILFVWIKRHTAGSPLNCWGRPNHSP